MCSTAGTLAPTLCIETSRVGTYLRGGVMALNLDLKTTDYTPVIWEAVMSTELGKEMCGSIVAITALH